MGIFQTPRKAADIERETLDRIDRLTQEIPARLSRKDAQIERLQARIRELEVMTKNIQHCENCGADWYDGGLNAPECPWCRIRELEQERDRETELRRKAEAHAADLLRDYDERHVYADEYDDMKLEVGRLEGLVRQAEAALRPLAALVHEDGVEAPYPAEKWEPWLSEAHATWSAVKRALEEQGQ